MVPTRTRQAKGKSRLWTALIALTLGFAGFFLMWASAPVARSLGAEEQPEQGVLILLQTLGATLIASGVGFVVLGRAGAEAEQAVAAGMDALHGSVQALDSKLRHSADELQSQFGETVQGLRAEFGEQVERLRTDLIDRMTVLDEAENCGIAHIFLGRRGDREFKMSLVTQMNGASAGSECLVMSNSLRDFVYDTDYKSAFIRAVRRGVRFRILLLDPVSDAAVARATVEEERTVADKGYVQSKIFTSIRDVARALATPSRLGLEGKVAERMNDQVHVRFFPFDPTTHLFVTEHYTFVEQYHRGGGIEIRTALEDDGMEGVDCFGGFVPVLMLRNSSRFAKLLQSHFQNTWDDPLVAARGLREHKYMQQIDEFRRNSGVNA